MMSFSRIGFISAMLLALATTAQCVSWQQPVLLDTVCASFELDSTAQTPAIAFTGSQNLIVWADKRNGDFDIYGARVTPSGRVLDWAGLPICSSVGDQLAPAVTYAHGMYLVVWEDQRSGWRWNIYAARVDTSGRVEDTDGIPVRLLNGDKHEPKVAPAESGYLVVWDEFLGDRNIMAALVDTSGVAGDAFAICDTQGVQACPDVVACDSGFAVTWEDSRDGGQAQVYCARLSRVGELLDSNGIRLAPDGYSQELPAIASDGTSYFISWQQTAYADDDICGVRLSPSGLVLDSLPISVCRAAGRQLKPRVAYADSSFYVIWDDHRDSASGTAAYAARVLPNGVLLDTDGFQVGVAANDRGNSTLGGGSGQLLACWEAWNRDTVHSHLMAARVSGNQVIDLNALVVPGRPYFYRQSLPAVVFGRDRYLTVWCDYRNDSLVSDIHGIMVDSTGQPMSSAAFPVAHGRAKQNLPAVAAGDSCFLVAWEDYRNGQSAIRAARIAESGRVLDPDGFRVSSSVGVGLAPSVTYDGRDFLVVWEDGAHTNIMGARVTPAGDVLDSLCLSVPPGYTYASNAASADTLSLVVWESSVAGRLRIVGRRVSQSGGYLDSIPFVVSDTSALVYAPAACSDGTNFLVIWQNRRMHEIYGTRVAMDGVVLDSEPMRLTRTDAQESYPRVVFDGHYNEGIWAAQSSAWNISGATVNSTGSLLDTFCVLQHTYGSSTPSIASDRHGRVLTVYSDRIDSSGSGPRSVVRTWGVLSEFPAACKESNLAPAGLKLCAHPTLFSGQVAFTIRSTNGLGSCRLIISDVTGREVNAWTSISGSSLLWNGTDRRGRALPAGVYLALLQGSNGAKAVRRIVKAQ